MKGTSEHTPATHLTYISFCLIWQSGGRASGAIKGHERYPDLDAGSGDIGLFAACVGLASEAEVFMQRARGLEGRPGACLKRQPQYCACPRGIDDGDQDAGTDTAPYRVRSHRFYLTVPIGHNHQRGSLICDVECWSNAALGFDAMYALWTHHERGDRAYCWSGESRGSAPGAGFRQTHRRLREIVNKVEPRFGSALMAYALYRSEPLPGLSPRYFLLDTHYRKARGPSHHGRASRHLFRRCATSAILTWSTAIMSPFTQPGIGCRTISRSGPE